MAQVPRGTTFFVASAYAAPKAVTAVSNAAEAVMTSAAHGFIAADILEVTSGWGGLNKRVVRVKSATSNDFVLENIDTSSLTRYPAGTGIGSVRKINTFQQITQVLGTSSSGGDPKSVEYSYIESDVDSSINDGFSATSYSLELDADANTTAGYLALRTLTEVQTDTCLLMQTRNGSKVYVPCTVALNETIQIQQGQVNRVKCAFNGNNRSTRY